MWRLRIEATSVPQNNSPNSRYAKVNLGKSASYYFLFSTESIPMEQESVVIVWREVLTGLFSVLGRMACLANCYDLQTRCYFHGKVAEQLGWKKADRALRMVHELVWADWMRGSLSQQQVDVQFYLSDGPLKMAQAVAVYRESQPFLGFIPASAEAMERTLFLSNLSIILDLLHNQYGSEAMTPDKASVAAHSDAYRQLIGIIREQYSNPDLSLKSLSAQVHLSDRQLRRIFRSSAEQTFCQYLRKLRITKSAKLLANSRYDVKAIAALVGYNDRSHFGEDFRHLMGCTPVEFRAKSNRTKSMVPSQTDIETAKGRCPVS